MDNKKAPPLNSSSETSDDGNIRSKLRRLRIQEALLLQSIQKHNKNTHEDVETFETERTDLSTSSYKDLLKKVKDAYVNLKNLYDEVKDKTETRELLADLDIDEIKKKIFELENNIKTFKLDITSELAALKLAEQDLNKQINENPNIVEVFKPRQRSHPKNYNAIVPSPVKVLMNSPFKCLEVQQFQEFMQNSPNRYGGWNEYNHNIFVKHWQKFFGNSYSSEFEGSDFEQSPIYEIFLEDVNHKLQGVTTNDITSHVTWYVKYLFLKRNQQNAINKWKKGRVPKKVRYAENSFPLDISMDDNSFIASFTNKFDHLVRSKTFNTVNSKKDKQGKEQKRTCSILKPTKQWLYRIHSDDGVQLSRFNNIENTEKLGKPHWRLGL